MFPVIQSLLFIIVLIVPAFLEPAMMTMEWLWFIILPLTVIALLPFLPDIAVGKNGRGWFSTAYSLIVVFLVALVFASGYLIRQMSSAASISRAMYEFVPGRDRVYQYGTCLYGVDFYTKKRTPVVDDLGEPDFGVSKLPPAERAQFFPESKEFINLAKTEDGVYCITNKPKRIDVLKSQVSLIHILWTNGNYFLLHIGGS